MSLEKKLCILRVPDRADKRIKRLSLTETGQNKVASLADLHDTWLHNVMTCLSAEEQEQFEGYCRRLLASAEKLTQSTGENGK